MRPRSKTDYIIIHCSATRADHNVTAEDIRHWHVVDNGWDDIGYHWVIERDGSVKQGRPVDVMGAHCRGVNDRSIGICLVGGCDEDMQPEDNFTERQMEMLTMLVVGHQKIYPEATVQPHNHFNEYKACPAFDVVEWFETVFNT